MTAYQDIYRDLPSRVNSVWQRAKTMQENEPVDLSVTAMLMAAAAGLAMPLEDIRIPARRTPRSGHVTREAEDGAAYETTVQTFKAFFSQSLAGNSLFQDVRFARCTELSDVRDVGEYGGGTAIELSSHDAGFAFSVLRNALAHNNIVAFGVDVERIEKLSFFSEWRKGRGCKQTVVGWNVVTFSTASFEKFLTFWFNLVSASGSYAAALEALAAQDVSSEA